MLSTIMPEASKTLTFLSADKILRITVDGEEIYTFGLHDRRLFGRTPGSVMVFADIPKECEAGQRSGPHLDAPAPFRRRSSAANSAPQRNPWVSLSDEEA